MRIGYFPIVYPNELLYSVFARYFSQSGCINYTQTAEELFVNPKERLDLLFTNQLRPEIISRLTDRQSLEEVLLNHTLFPYYARFLPYERRKTAYGQILTMSGIYRKILSITPNRNQEKQYLKYCPICIEEDRKKYGESYWNRIHQIPEITVCPIHGCRLLNSTVEVSRRNTRYFYPADNVEDMTITYGSKKEQDISIYLKAVIERKLDIEKKFLIGDLLSNALQGTEYASVRGEMINVNKLSQDFFEFYKGFHSGIDKQWQISKLLHNQRMNPYEIIQMAYFLQIPIDDLINGNIPCQSNCFEEGVIESIRNGKSMYQIAKETGVSPSLIHLVSDEYSIKPNHTKAYATKKKAGYEQRIIEERKFWLEVIETNPGVSYSVLRSIPEYTSRLNWLRRHDTEWTDKHYPQKAKSTQKIENLKRMDSKYLPIVRQAIEDYKEKEGEKPKRITISAISDYLGMKGRTLYHLEQCRKEIEKHYEDQNEYWARKIIWAVHKMIEEDLRRNWKQLHDLLHIPRQNIVECFPLIEQSGNVEVLRVLQEII